MGHQARGGWGLRKPGFSEVETGPKRACQGWLAVPWQGSWAGFSEARNAGATDSVGLAVQAGLATSSGLAAEGPSCRRLAAVLTARRAGGRGPRRGVPALLGRQAWALAPGLGSHETVRGQEGLRDHGPPQGAATMGVGNVRGILSCPRAGGMIGI